VKKRLTRAVKSSLDWQQQQQQRQQQQEQQHSIDVSLRTLNSCAAPILFFSLF
jgi:hypothetical protein